MRQSRGAPKKRDTVALLAVTRFQNKTADQIDEIDHTKRVARHGGNAERCPMTAIADMIPLLQKGSARIPPPHFHGRPLGLGAIKVLKFTERFYL
jgi:hypothetical protein